MIRSCLGHFRRLLWERHIAIDGLIFCGYALIAAATAYGIIAWLATTEPPQSVRPAGRVMPGVTVLKPVCGVEPETYECLRSFCEQAYADFQIIFGVADPDDPVVLSVRRLQQEFPQRDLQVTIDRRQHGSSRKISNLINMMPQAKYDFLVLADSDVRVTPEYLTDIVAPLLDRTVGIVTCAYRGVSRQGLWSTLGCMFINEWFMPSVRVAAWAGSRCFAFGATIALRREVLMRIGGFDAIANHLADDYRLGELTRRLGLRTVLSSVEVEIAVAESSFRALAEHELRWLRTIRALRPIAYSFYFVTFAMPVAVLGAVLCAGGRLAFTLLAITVVARVLLHKRKLGPHDRAIHLVLLPLRDFLSLGLWGWSFTTRRVRWRNAQYKIGRDGSALPVVRI